MRLRKEALPMAKDNNSNKGWGGPFDFNGDGKPTW